LITAGVYLATQPRYSTTVVVTGTSYYYAGGVYYVNQGGRYVVVGAPLGAVVYAVPTTTTVVYVGQTPYYYYNGTYYAVTAKPAEKPDVSVTNVNVTVNTSAESDGDGELKTSTSTMITADGQKLETPPVPLDDEQNYEVVAPPVGASVPYLPERAHEKTVKGKKYFEYNGAYYRPFSSDGDTVYMVVEDPN